MSVKNAEVKSGPRIGRRAALAAVGVGVVGAGALAAPTLVPLAEQRIQQAERDAILGEIGNLEGVSLDAAIRAAEITRAAVQVIVLPVARLVSRLGSGALNLIIGSLNAAINALNVIHVRVDLITGLRDVLVTWNNNLNALPIKLSDYTTADITSAEKYLKSLKQKTQHPQG